MLVLCIRTDKPESELYLYNGDTCIGQALWLAHRQLAETIHTKIDELLQSQKKTLQDVDKVVVYSGPGSFTGLRIGVSVANALAYSLAVPVVGTTGEDWAVQGVRADATVDTFVQPQYGQDPHITQQKK